MQELLKDTQKLFTLSDMRSISVLALVVANLIPLFGVLFLDWNLFLIMVLYWSENVVIGFYNVIRMRRATKLMPDNLSGLKLNGKPYAPEKKGQLITFFIMHYGMFTAVHGVFVWTVFHSESIPLLAFVFGVLSLFCSHGVSYFTNFIGKNEYQRVSAPDLFMQPYKRVVILHVTIIFGAGLVSLTDAPVIALVILITLKTIVDIILHLLEHAGFAKNSISEP